MISPRSSSVNQRNTVKVKKKGRGLNVSNCTDRRQMDVEGQSTGAQIRQYSHTWPVFPLSRHPTLYSPQASAEIRIKGRWLIWKKISDPNTKNTQKGI